MSAILKALPQRRGRQPRLPAVASLLCFYPRFKAGRSFMYAVGFKGGVVKVGRTVHPRDRLREHFNRADGEVLWVHLFTSMHVRTAMRAEQAAIRALSHAAEQINHSEWFKSELSREEVLRLVRQAIDEARADVQAAFDKQRKVEEVKQREKAAMDRARQLLNEAGLRHVDVALNNDFMRAQSGVQVAWYQPMPYQDEPA